MRRNRGFTLIELLAAMAILAVVSVMAVQALSGAVFQRSVLARVDDDAAALARALALLRHDLEAVAPIPRVDETGARHPAIEATARGLTLVRGGLVALRGELTSGYGVVTWRLAPEGTLSRQISVDPGLEASAAPEAVILTEVLALRLSALQGALPDVQTPDLLPPGFALTLEHARHGTLELVVAR